MAVKLVANYAKKLGLPGYSSHQFSVSVETEVMNVDGIGDEAERLYQQLQQAVDKEIQQPGFVPPHEYAMAPGQNGNGHQRPQAQNGHRPPPVSNGSRANMEQWNCTEGQQGLITRLVHDNQLDKNEVEGMAQQLFGIGVKQLNKLQASQLIEDLLEKTGKKVNGSRWRNGSNRARSKSMIAAVEPIEAAPSISPSPDEMVEQLMKTVSASRLSTYLSCRLKFLFRYVLEMKKPKSAALHVGGAVHSVLKTANKARWRGEPLTLTQLHEQFVKAWADTEEPIQWEDGEETAEQNTAWRLLETYIRQVGTQPKPEAVEVPIEADLKQKGLPKVVGILDLVEGGFIKDYKTSGQTPNPEKVAHVLETQTSIYSLLYRENTGKREKGIELVHLVKLKNPKVVTVPLPPMSPSQESRLYSLIEGYQQGLSRKDFLPSPGMQCGFCEYFNECRAWR